jgi:hypothetical protein
MTDIRIHPASSTKSSGIITIPSTTGRPMERRDDMAGMAWAIQESTADLLSLSPVERQRQAKRNDDSSKRVGS